MNTLRAFLYELGDVAPEGMHNLPRIAAVVTHSNNDLPEIVSRECHDLLGQIEVMIGRLAASDHRIKALAGKADVARRLQTMPGAGPLAALAVEAFAPSMENFQSGGTLPLGRDWSQAAFKRRQEATWPGL